MGFKIVYKYFSLFICVNPMNLWLNNCLSCDQFLSYPSKSKACSGSRRRHV